MTDDEARTEPTPTATESPANSDEPGTARPVFVHQAPKHGLIGPFGGRQITMGVLLIAAVVVALVAITAPLGNTGTLARPNPQATPFLIGPAAPGLSVGAAAPDFTTTLPNGSAFRLTDLDGTPLSLADLRGKAVWLNFWASWCAPCQSETPILRTTAAAYKDRGLVVVGISVQELSASDVAAYVKKYSLGYTVAADVTGQILHLYRINALPTQFFIDAQGRISSIVLGPLDQDSATNYVESILPPAGS